MGSRPLARRQLCSRRPAPQGPSGSQHQEARPRGAPGPQPPPAHQRGPQCCHQNLQPQPRPWRHRCPPRMEGQMSLSQFEHLLLGFCPSPPGPPQRPPALITQPSRLEARPPRRQARNLKAPRQPHRAPPQPQGIQTVPGTPQDASPSRPSQQTASSVRPAWMPRPSRRGRPARHCRRPRASSRKSLPSTATWTAGWRL